MTSTANYEAQYYAQTSPPRTIYSQAGRMPLTCCRKIVKTTFDRNLRFSPAISGANHQPSLVYTAETSELQQLPQSEFRTRRGQKVRVMGEMNTSRK